MSSGNCTLLAAGLAGLLAILLIGVGIWAFIGFILATIWQFAVVAVWPTLPAILWWQFSLMGFGLSLAVKIIVSGCTVKI
jgi:hypothetical protein